MQGLSAGVLLAVGLVALAGMAISTQGGINSALARNVGGPIPAATVSFLIGTVALVAITLALYGASPFRALAGVPQWQLMGGLLGAYYVVSVTWGMPQLGVLTTAAALILGQIVAALVLDAVGAFGLPVQPISIQRLAAAGLVAAGLYLSRA